jgi:hypothetical protein
VRGIAMTVSHNGKYYYPAGGFLFSPAQQALQDVAEAMGFPDKNAYLDTLGEEGPAILRRLVTTLHEENDHAH